MLLAMSLLRLPEFKSLLGLCLVGMLSGCAMEYADAEGSVSGEESASLTDLYWVDLGRPTVNGSKIDAIDLAVSYLTGPDADVWIVGVDGQVWNRTGSTAWAAVTPPSTGVQGVAAARRGNQTDLVVSDNAGKVWCRTRNSSGGWELNWHQVGATAGTAKGKPAASSVTGTDRLDVWIRGTDNALWHAYRIGTQAWSAWINEGMPSGGLLGPPAAYTRKASPLTIDVVARGTGNIVDGYKTWHRAWLNGWHAWEDVGLLTPGNPSVGVNVFAQAYVLGQGVGIDDTAIVARYWNGAWNGGAQFALPSTGIAGSPVFTTNDHVPDLYVRGIGNNVWRLK